MNPTISNLLIQLCRAHRNTAERELNEIGLYAGQEAVLLSLMAEDGLSQGKLANALGVEAPTITKAINRLARGGFLERRPDPEDGRMSRVYLTAEGRELEDRIREIWDGIEHRLTEGLSEAEKALLQRVIPHMRDNLEIG